MSNDASPTLAEPFFEQPPAAFPMMSAYLPMVKSAAMTSAAELGVFHFLHRQPASPLDAARRAGCQRARHAEPVPCVGIVRSAPSQRRRHLPQRSVHRALFHAGRSDGSHCGAAVERRGHEADDRAHGCDPPRVGRPNRCGPRWRAGPAWARCSRATWKRSPVIFPTIFCSTSRSLPTRVNCSISAARTACTPRPCACAIRSCTRPCSIWPRASPRPRA